MKTTTNIARMILAGTTAVLLSLPASAQTVEQTGYAAMYKNINAGLVALQVPTTDLNKLNAEQLGQLAAILDGQDTDVDKKAAAETVFRDSLMPVMVPMGSAGAQQIKEQLMANLASVGLEYPTDQRLSFLQVQKLMDIFQTPNDSDKTEAEGVLAEITAPTADTMKNPGARQLRDEIYSDLAKVGVVLPAGTVLTFDQVVDLTAVFDRDVADAEKATAAKAILGMM